MLVVASRRIGEKRLCGREEFTAVRSRVMQQIIAASGKKLIAAAEQAGLQEDARLWSWTGGPERSCHGGERLIWPFPLQQAAEPHPFEEDGRC